MYNSYSPLRTTWKCEKTYIILGQSFKVGQIEKKGKRLCIVRHKPQGVGKQTHRSQQHTIATSKRSTFLLHHIDCLYNRSLTVASTVQMQNCFVTETGQSRGVKEFSSHRLYKRMRLCLKLHSLASKLLQTFCKHHKEYTQKPQNVAHLHIGIWFGTSRWNCWQQWRRKVSFSSHRIFWLCPLNLLWACGKPSQVPLESVIQGVNCFRVVLFYWAWFLPSASQSVVIVPLWY